MPPKVFEMDGQTVDLLDDMKKVFGVDSNAQVIRKALALAHVAMRNVDDEGFLTIAGPAGPVRVDMRH